MGIKWRNKAFKASIVSLAFLLTINPLDFNSIIKANETESEASHEIVSEEMNNSNLIESRNAGNYGASIDFRKNFKFSAAFRNDSGIVTSDKLSDLRTTVLLNPDKNTDDSHVRIGAARYFSANKQSIYATSQFPIDMNRPFEVNFSYKMGSFPHGFAFALHQEENYKPGGTDDSLGLYYDPGRQQKSRYGLKNAFIMEFDSFKDEVGAYGDNVSAYHYQVGETDYNGQHGSVNGQMRGEILETVVLNKTEKDFVFNKQWVNITLSWNGKQTVSIKFPDNLSRFNYVNKPGKVIQTLYKMQRNNNGKAYLSLGGTTDGAGNNYMEMKINDFKYNDLVPQINTHIKDAKTGQSIKSVTPGQEVVIRHELHNSKSVDKDLQDGIVLNLLTLQFLNKNEIGQHIEKKNNLQLKDKRIETWKDSEQKRNVINDFDTTEPKSIPVIFPKVGYFNIEYRVIVPSSISNQENYNKELFLYFLATIDQSNVKVGEGRRAEPIRLRPDIISEKGGYVRNEHEIFKYSVNNQSVDKNIIKQELFDKLFVNSTKDWHSQILFNTDSTTGTTLIKKYFLNGVEKPNLFTDKNIQVNKGDAVTLAIEAKDSAHIHENLKTYYYRSIVFADTFTVLDDGNYLLYGNNNGGSKSETELNKTSIDSFKNEVKRNTSANAIHREFKDAFSNFSNFSNKESDIDVTVSHLKDGKIIDMEAINHKIPITLNDTSLRIEANYNVTPNVYSKADGDIKPNGTTGYIIIPSKITVSDVPDTDTIRGSGEVFMSGYTSNKKYDVSTDSTIMLSSGDKNVKLTVSNGKNNLSDIKNGRIRLGKLKEGDTKGKGINFNLSGSRYTQGELLFKGRINFYFNFSWH